MDSIVLSTEARTDIAHLVHPYTNVESLRQQGPLIVERGEGVYVFDRDGRRYLEGMAGLWSASLGFSEPRLAEAAARQFAKLPYYQVFGQRSHAPAIELAEKLVGLAPSGLSHVLFANSGSEANDAAAKLVWYYNNQRGRRAKKKLVARYNGYHGVTVMAASLTGVPAVHADFDLPLDRVVRAQQPSYYHLAHDRESPGAFGQRMVEELEALILREDPETIGAFFAEPVSASAGVILPPPGYFGRVQEILRRHDILFVVDEVITGFGRTGTLFASELYGLRPDLLTAAKALSASYLPISALLMTDRIHEAIVAGSGKNGAFAHGVTYAAHPVCAAVALEALAIYAERDTVGHVQRVSPHFLKRLHGLTGHPLVGDARGVGLLGAVELVADKRNKRSFLQPLAAFIQKRALDYGVIVRGSRDSIAVSPPLIITVREIDELFDGLDRALDDGWRHARSEGWL